MYRRLLLLLQPVADVAVVGLQWSPLPEPLSLVAAVRSCWKLLRLVLAGIAAAVARRSTCKEK